MTLATAVVSRKINALHASIIRKLLKIYFCLMIDASRSALMGIIKISGHMNVKLLSFIQEMKVFYSL